ncbi:multidrug efflux SMR transporter [Pseudogracilibacillus sp. SE30717A]|uniref:DMT family transporter n=1 Tax=Pseudogracilibacillus sp. SE30717A TaxID=3098293 RepID=UPI00300DDE4D
MAWVYLVIASFGEIFGVASINMFLKRKSVLWLFILILTFGFGFVFLSLAVREIPLGTAYAIWTGLGATGAVLMGIFFFRESASLLRIVFLTCIITGAVGLKVFG